MSSDRTEPTCLVIHILRDGTLIQERRVGDPDDIATSLQDSRNESRRSKTTQTVVICDSSGTRHVLNIGEIRRTAIKAASHNPKWTH